MPFLHKSRLQNATRINSVLETGFLHHYQQPDVRKTHQFHGRYENIYLNKSHIPEIETVINQAIYQAEKLLGITHLRAGYWFNFMPPGSITTLHSHDDDDELLSAVYYICVPDNCGELILHASPPSPNTIKITPQAGLFVFFKPDAKHEVTENRCDQNRLSIGMNFGVLKPE